MTATVSARGLTHRFGPLDVLGGVDLEIEAGALLALAGPSGSGKSTLLEITGGLREQSGGLVEVNGSADAAGRLRGCAWMPQRDCLLPWYSALDNASLALVNQGKSRREARKSAAERFEHFGLEGFETARPDELSGGMRQRVAFIRTLLSAKPVLLLDEPLAALDAITRAELQEWLTPVLRESGATVLLVTHDVEEAIYLADRVTVLSPRPGRSIATIDGMRGSPGRRDEVVSSPAFNRKREELLGLLRSDQARGAAR
ncbi:MAG TPA: ABC transporter ATP-binding protein [Solirubrobacterales bacterium]|nr:ABC transporter ATP-binding protein [Solirubrobacterales bacterium]HMX70359.1 ABC transporter ATP-binding protein [Solirubrobacterales bacterium]HMY24749.1 ABC transporter ATP-binding protein [Solirubrobacterales bacterium]HNA23740.1 ABC transporter ATP-binding protein [Solirubrobacterales bacterium]HNA44258.1 ABC transporter ATP-binding protein [Solirubrobacterales bacterium]